MKIEQYIVKNTLNMPKLVGDSHRYKTPKGEISCVYPCDSTFQMYEICCLEGDFPPDIDIERFDSLEEAESRIRQLLIGLS